MTMLAICDAIPDDVLTADAGQLHEVLQQPTLFLLPGRRPEPLFVSVLLHGNEDVGWRAAQELLRAQSGKELPRTLALFVGNVSAARADRRRLDGQPDYNRVWPGAEDDGTPEHAMMRQIVAELERRRVFASIDLHNNTGRNPHYGCINRTDFAFLHLAALFSRTVVYFERPRGVQSMAFARLCPAVTCECGKVGDPTGVSHAAEFLDAALHLSELPAHPVAEGDIHLFHTVVTVKIPADVTLAFGDDGEADLVLPADLDEWNFQPLAAGAVLGRSRPGARLIVRDAQLRDVTAEYLSDAEGVVRLARPVMPAMLTVDERVIRQDCLGYFMERYPLPS